MDLRVLLLALMASLAIAAGGAAAVSLQPNTPASDADIMYVGGAHDYLPSSLTAGRWNGDPFDDVLTCSWTNNSCWLFFGNAASSARREQGDITFVGPAGGFGGSATFLGDINGDGYQDIAIGAPYTAGSGTVVRGGSLWVFFGGPGPYAGTVGYYEADLIVFSSQNFAELGASASPAGDMNGDGTDDFWVSAPAYNGSTGAQGSIFLFLGKRQFPASINETSAALAIEGIAPPSEGGHVLLGRHDLNRDGRPDFVVSSASYTGPSGTVVGAAHVYLGPLPRSKAVLSTADADVHLWGTDSVPSLGRSLAFATNFTRGGQPTLLVGADIRNASAAEGGAIYLFNSSQFACCQVLHTWDADGLLYSPEADDAAGTSIAVGDFDGDGFVDLAVGAPLARNRDNVTVGRVYLIYGNTTGPSPFDVRGATGWINGPGANSSFGVLVTALSLDGNNKTDIVVGAPGARAGPPSGGVDYAFYGRPRNRAPVVSINVSANATEGELFLASINVTDLDNDRLAWEWYVGAGATPGKTENATEVFLMFPDDGNYTVYIDLTDGDFRVFAQAHIRVANAPPVCDIAVDREFVEGATGRLRVNLSDPGADRLNFTWFGPEAMLPQLNGRADYTAPNGRPFNVSVVVWDDDGGSGSCGLTVPVQNVPPHVSISNPPVVYEGDHVLLTASASDPGDAEEFTFYWQTPVGEVDGPSFEWWASAPGFFSVDLTGVDSDGGAGTDHVVVHVINRLPDVVLALPSGAFEGDNLTLSVEQVTGAAYDELTYTWSVCNYGTAVNTREFFKITRAIPGRFCVYVHVADDDGAVVEFEGTLVVANRAPLTGVRVTPDPPYAENQQITFTATLSPYETSSSATIKYNWTLNGLVASWSQVYRPYLPAGDHRVAVEATDADGGVSRFSVRIVIENVPPVVRITGPNQVQPGSLNTWLAAASDPSGGAVTVHWEIDGMPSVNGTKLEWVSRSPGPHSLRVWAVDGAGAASSATLSVEVLGPPTEGAGIDLSWLGIVVGASAAFAAGIVLGAYVLDRVRNRRKVDELWKR